MGVIQWVQGLVHTKCLINKAKHTTTLSASPPRHNKLTCRSDNFSFTHFHITHPGPCYLSVWLLLLETLSSVPPLATLTHPGLLRGLLCSIPRSHRQMVTSSGSHCALKIILVFLYYISLLFFWGCTSLNVLWNMHTVGIQEKCIKWIALLALDKDTQEGQRPASLLTWTLFAASGSAN